jgi:hypothetical protein
LKEKEKKGEGEEEEEEKEEDSLDYPKHPIRTMLSNRTIIESRSSRIFIVNSRESSCSVYYLSVPVSQNIRDEEGILTFPRIKATCFGGFITYISPIRQGCCMLSVSSRSSSIEKTYRSTTPDIFKSISLSSFHSEWDYSSAYFLQAREDEPNRRTP